MLEPVDDLREIVGYAVAQDLPARPPGERSPVHEALAGRLGNAIAHRLVSRLPRPATTDRGIGHVEPPPCADAVALAPPRSGS
jgi:hypothetical protein